MYKFIALAEKISAFSGKFFSWSVLILTLVVCYDVFMRYIANNQTQWGFDLSYMLYGTLFMAAGAYTLSRDGHVRADMMYRTLQPKTQAIFDLALYLCFFLPGIGALFYAGFFYALDSYKIGEVSSVTSSGVPLYPLKFIIPISGFLLLVQGVSEIFRSIICIQTGSWPERGKDFGDDIDQLESVFKD